MANVLDASRKKVTNVVKRFTDILIESGVGFSEFENNVILLYLGAKKYNSPETELHRWAPLVYTNNRLYILRRKRMKESQAPFFAYNMRAALQQALHINPMTMEERTEFLESAKSMTKEDILNVIAKDGAVPMKRLQHTRRGKIEKKVFISHESCFKLTKKTRGYFVLSNGAYQLTKYGITVIKPKNFNINYEYSQRDLRAIKYALSVLLDNGVPDYRTISFFQLANLAETLHVMLDKESVTEDMFAAYNKFNFEKPYYFQIWQAMLSELSEGKSPREKSFEVDLS